MILPFVVINAIMSTVIDLQNYIRLYTAFKINKPVLVLLYAAGHETSHEHLSGDEHAGAYRATVVPHP
jgi:hypothetical protein